MFCPDYGNFNYSFLLLILLITQSLQLYSRVGSWLSIYLIVSYLLHILIKPAEKAVKRDTVRTFSNIFYSCIPQFSCFFLYFGPEQAYDDWFVTKYFHPANHSSKNAKYLSVHKKLKIMPRPRMNVCSYLHFLTAPQIILF